MKTSSSEVAQNGMLDYGGSSGKKKCTKSSKQNGTRFRS